MAPKSIFLFAALALVAQTTIAQSTQYSDCVQSCFTTDPISSACNGDETGQAKDDCTCASYAPTNDPLITCIQQCPTADQIPYAQHLPAECRQNLFPNLDLSSASSSTTAAAPSATDGGSSSTGSAATSTSATDSSTESSSTAQSSPSASATPDAAMGMQVSGMNLALGGLLAIGALI